MTRAEKRQPPGPPVHNCWDACQVRGTAFGLMLERMRDGIVLQDMSARIEWANPACEAMFGWTLREMQGRKPQDFLLPPDKRPGPEAIAAFRFDPERSLFSQLTVTEHIRRDGTRFWNQQSFSIIDMGPKDTDKKVVITCRDVTEQVRNEQRLGTARAELEHAAYHDALTGLANRKRLGDFMQSARVRAEIARGRLGVLQVDIDKFKDINDTFGHAAGDRTLRHVAAALCATISEAELACRTGGDEFLLILPETPSKAALLERAEALQKAIRAPLTIGARGIHVSVSVGASLPDPCEVTDTEALLHMADQALYAAKDQGRDRIVFYDAHLGRRLQAEQLLARDLAKAVTDCEFGIFLQPQLDLTRTCISGFEALLRWHHPIRGILPPAEFLMAAEKNGCLADIDYMSMNLALDALATLRREGFSDLSMSINVSSSILADVNYPGLLDWAMQSRGIPPDRICIEILETTILDQDGLDVMTAVDRLKRLGVRVALDDFGTGYAGLAHMSAFDIDAIKLDRSMIARLEEDPRNRMIVRSIIRLCRLLDVAVVAEGVETGGQLDILRRSQCPMIQGYGLARPMPVSEAIAWMHEMRASPHPPFLGLPESSASDEGPNLRA
ncbi:putative bifunctional diguanylate cyclase/phosphodiesterase [Roseovarius faecimaris]|uniref:putative bifunctional diguanylate cyclase/phosphodiesterase n=1 Tax=Roseovarius faecimaris TaxID=2494550 RepID=UPI0018E02274|nr:EAL domain-containing protein [Roseovarius faecimaris]